MAMSNNMLHDDAQTVAGLGSIAGLFEWMRSMPAPERKRFWTALAECSEEVQRVVAQAVDVIKNPHTTPHERKRALATIADALSLNPDDDGEYGQDLVASEAKAAAQYPSLAHEVQKMDSQQAAFARRLRDLIEAKRISQVELAERVGCSQPAISQMLNRNCRPRKMTILKLAEALNVQATDLWPDIDVADMLDAVASFQEDDYAMTEAEARALADTSRPNRPRIQPKSLPKRRR
jgi:transcriptional regulator with XRE-family HTH domain